MRTAFPISQCQLPVTDGPPPRRERFNAPTLQRSNASTSPAAFTLIELIAVIAVIAMLAALIIPITGAVNKQKILKRARVELTQVETAIGAYKARLGFYPPDNPGLWSTNQLYYELLGTTNNGTVYSTLDNSAQIPNNVSATFGPSVGGFVNCSRGGAADEAQNAQNFLKGLRAGEFLAVTAAWSVLGSTILDGPMVIPSATASPRITPWCYNSSHPFKNPNSFDLWIDVKVGGTVYRISNWSQTAFVNPPSYPN